MSVIKIIENEIKGYLYDNREISEGYKYNEYKLKKRIALYQNNIYPKGKLTKQGDYKFWIDIIQPRVDAEVKNIDFDTNAIMYYSEVLEDAGYMLLCNLKLKEWLRDTQQASEINEAIEEFSAWGNVVWKKIPGGFEKADLKNLYVINTTAKTLDETPVIEKHILSASDLQAKSNVWDNVDRVISECKGMSFSKTTTGAKSETEIPYYEIYERNGEISEYDLNSLKGIVGGDKNKMVLAKIIVAGLNKTSSHDSKYILFADIIPAMPYKEAHRGPYKGRWFRVGMYEMLFDIQTRCNDISNQIARGLEWASKTIFKTEDNLLVQNILTDLENGDVIRSRDLSQIDIRMHGLDQLIADWNRLMEAADRLSNAFDIVTGADMPSGTPFKLGSMMNTNANKLYEYIREKLSVALQSVYQDWVLPIHIKELKAKDILRLTGDPSMMKRYYNMIVNSWYVNNLIDLPPHGPEMEEALKQKKLEEIMASPETLIKLEEGWLDNVKPRVSVVIDGENINLKKENENLSAFIQLEVDPIRRTALIETAMKRNGIDVEGLPKSPPPPDPNQMEGGDPLSQIRSKSQMAIAGQLSPNKEFSKEELNY